MCVCVCVSELCFCITTRSTPHFAKLSTPVEGRRAGSQVRVSPISLIDSLHWSAGQTVSSFCAGLVDFDIVDAKLLLFYIAWFFTSFATYETKSVWMHRV